MRSTWFALCLVWAMMPCIAAQELQPPRKTAETPFWLSPKIELSLAPATVELVAGPDTSRPFALLQTTDLDPRKFVVSNPLLMPFQKDAKTGYSLISNGLKMGAFPYVDRSYKIKKLDPAFHGLPLLQTKNGDKPILDGRFAITLSAAKSCYVLVALDERVLDTYKQFGIPGWLQEYAPTAHKIETDDPLMDAGVGYLVFARKAAPGRIALGPPCMDQGWNSMYFAFFADAK